MAAAESVKIPTTIRPKSHGCSNRISFSDSQWLPSTCGGRRIAAGGTTFLSGNVVQFVCRIPNGSLNAGFVPVLDHGRRTAAGANKKTTASAVMLTRSPMKQPGESSEKPFVVQVGNLDVIVETIYGKFLAYTDHAVTAQGRTA